MQINRVLVVSAADIKILNYRLTDNV